MKDNKEFWQRVAKIYAPFMKGNSFLYEEICDNIIGSLNDEMDVLELACGSGQLSFSLSKYVRSYVASDFSEKMIVEASKNNFNENLLFTVQDATNLSYKDNSFDVIIISNALHIMPYPKKALKEIKRVLKHNGILFAPTFIHGNGAAYRLRIRMMELIGFKTFYKWTEKEFVMFLEENGFEVNEHMILGDTLTPLCYVKAKQCINDLVK